MVVTPSAEGAWYLTSEEPADPCTTEPGFLSRRWIPTGAETCSTECTRWGSARGGLRRTAYGLLPRWRP